MSTPTPQTIAEITPAWIDEVLRSAGAIGSERASAIETRPIGEGQGFLSTMAVVKVEYDPPTASGPTGVVVKLEPAAGKFRDTERENKAFAREVDFYRELAPTIDVRVPHVYYAVANDDGMALVMEDLSRLRCGDQLRGMQHEEVLATVREIARVHAAFWETDRLAAIEWLPDHDQLWREGFEEHWPGFAAEYGTRLGREELELGERVRANLDWLKQQIAGRPATLVHADLRADNLLFGEARSKDAVVVLDWQLATRSMAAIDPTRLLGGSEPAAQRDGHHLEVFTAWHEALLTHGVTGYEFDDALHDFRLGALFNLMVPVKAHSMMVGNTGLRGWRLLDAIVERVYVSALELDAGSLLCGDGG